MNPEFLAMSNLKKTVVFLIQNPIYLWKVINSEKHVESDGHDTQRNTNVNYIVFVKVP